MAKNLVYHDNIGFHNEAISSIVFTTGTNVQAVLYSINLGDKLRIGDYLNAFASFEATDNDATNNILIGKQLFLCEHAGDFAGTEVTAGNGTNVTPAEHHNTQTDIGGILIDRLDRPYLNFVLTVGGNTVASPLTIEQGYGNLYYEIHRDTLINSSTIGIELTF